MNKDELMKPRYKVIALYPDSPNKIGDIIHVYGQGYIYPDKVEANFDRYPHLFKKLQWWEEREISELPEYLKWKNNPEVFKPYTIEILGFGRFYLSREDYIANNDYDLSHTLPSSVEEFNNLKHKK